MEQLGKEKIATADSILVLRSVLVLTNRFMLMHANLLPNHWSYSI